jgi:hypothetical protein
VWWWRTKDRTMMVLSPAMAMGWVDGRYRKRSWCSVAMGRWRLKLCAMPPLCLECVYESIVQGIAQLLLLAESMQMP